MPPIKGQMLKYSEEQMKNALADVARGVPVATAAKNHNVPRVTLLYKSKGKTPINRKMGPDTYLSKEEESLLVNWIISVGRAGFPVTKDQLLNSVKILIEQLKRKTPFKNSRPGKTWYKSFLKRHPEISPRVAQNLTSSRAKVTQEQLTNWFQEVSEYLEANNYSDIIQNPSRVFNGDETAFFLNPKGGKVLAKKGDKTIYQQVNNDDKECLTVLITGNANGDLVPPTVIFQYERIPQDLAESIPHSWGIGKSSSGWMTGVLFYEFLTNIFDPWLEEQGIERPVILFIDGHSSHLTLNTSKFCDEKKIILVALFPNATHLLQPMDVSVFRSLKGCWKNVVHDWRIENIQHPILKRRHFANLLKKVLDSQINPEMLKNGFRKCGLCPWNPNVIINLTATHQSNMCVQSKNSLKELETVMGFLDKYIESEKIEKFKNSANWEGDLQDLSLFEFYKNIQTKVENLKQNEATLNEQVREEIDVSYQEQNAQTQRRRSSVDIQKDGEQFIESSTISKTPMEVQNDLQTHQTRTPLKIIEVNNIDETLQPTTSSNFQQNNNTSYYVPDDTIYKTHKNQTHTILPSPFKRALCWPEPVSETSKKRKKEKIPSVVTSKAWQRYWEKKEQEKKDKEVQKLQRAEERKKKRDLKSAEKEEKRNNRLAAKENKSKSIKKKNIRSRHSSSDSTEYEDWVESGSSMDDISFNIQANDSDSENYEDNQCDFEFKEGDFVLVSFPGKKRSHRYMCIIQNNLNQFETEVIALNYCNEAKTIFRLNERDVSVINTSQIIKKLDAPNIVSSGDRVRYEFSSAISVDG